MGNTFGDITPTDVSVNCAAVQQDARWDYRCSTSWQSRLGLTTIHLIVMVGVYFVTIVIYGIHLQIVDRRARLQLRAFPPRALPYNKSSIPRRLYRAVIAHAARFSSEATLIAPPPSNAHASPRGWGTPPHDGVHFKSAVAQIGVEIDKLIEGVVPAELKSSVRGRSLAAFAEYFISTHGAPRDVLTDLAAGVDRAVYCDQYEFTQEEYATVAAAWVKLTTILAQPASSGSQHSSSNNLVAAAGALSPTTVAGVLSSSLESPLLSTWEPGAFSPSRARTPAGS